MSLGLRAIVPIGFLIVTAIGCSSGSDRPSAAGGGGHAGTTADGGPSGDAAGAVAGAAGTGLGAGGASMLGGAGGASMLGGAGGALQPPAGWTCTPSTYGDGHQCECGCGIPDPDCKSGDVTSCDNCLAEGSCANGLCPSSIAPTDNAHCAIPALWTCGASSYGDGICNCGCGVVDVDCPDATAASCQACDQSSCSPLVCAGIEPDDNAHCAAPPGTWQCSPRLYRDGRRCDCGCGAVDPDCASLGLGACDTCNDPGSCSAQACPGLIDATFNDHCDVPATPPGWSCGPGTYGDGTCDCGCSIADVDCRTPDVTSCVRCLECGGDSTCGSTIDSADPTQCAPPPTGWTCSAAAYRDIACDCGCGVPDPMCQGIETLYVCEDFPVEGCSGGNKLHIDPSQNALCIISVPDGWTCDRSYYDDGICDCGCGALDLDCPSNDVADCWQCNGTGSCSASACPGTIVPDDTAHCSN